MERAQSQRLRSFSLGHSAPKVTPLSATRHRQSSFLALLHFLPPQRVLQLLAWVKGGGGEDKLMWTTEKLNPPKGKKKNEQKDYSPECLAICNDEK